MKDPEVQRIAYLANKTNRMYGRVPEVIQKDPKFKQFMQKSKPIVSKGYGKATQMGSGTNPEKLRQQHLAKKDGWGSTYKADYEIRRGASSAVSGRGSGMARKMNPHDFDKMHGGTMSSYGELQQIEKEKLPRLQSQGKTTLLTNQTTRKGGGKSGGGGGKSGGGGGKFGWIRRMVNRPASPWSLLRTDKNF